MNRIYRLVWNQLTNTWVPVAETAKGRSKGSGRKLIAAALSLAATATWAGPDGGQVVAGTGGISQSGATTTIVQTSQNLSLTWNSFNVGAQETVNFVQPNAAAIAVNRIFDTSASHILGHLNANGQVYLINPNGVVFGQGAQVNVGGLVASTLDLNDASLNSNIRSFSGNGSGSVINQGSINASSGGYVALLGNTVSNQGSINAPRGTVALGAGSAATLTFQNNSLVRMQIDQSTLNNLAENQQLIQADGGTVFMSAGAKDALLASVVNNSGVIEARTVENHAGTIVLLGGMTAGTVHVGGTLDASAPDSGNGGFVETSAAHVKVADGTRVSTLAAHGETGTWLIDPTDFTISSGSAAQTGSGIGASTLSSNLASSNVTLTTDNSSGTDNGDIHVNAAVNWSANKLTLNAYNNININANLNGSGSASLALLYGQGTASGGTSNYNVKAEVNLAAGNNFSTQLGSTGPLINYTVITALGAQGSSTAADLQGINGGLSGNYVLGANIDAADTATWNAGAGFAPLGTFAGKFTGIFAGLGHSISNLTINRPSTSNVGLFGSTDYGSQIRDLGLVGGSVTGAGSVGMLAGANYGSISNSYANGNVVGTTNTAGGLVGFNAGTISNSYTSGNTSGNNIVGGLVGNSNGTISNAYASGAVSGSYIVGGLVGNGNGTISNAYASGRVSGAASGGLAGYASAGWSGVSNSFWDATTTGQATSVGGGTGLTTAQMHSASSFAPWSISANGGVATTWRIYEGQTNPLLRSFLKTLNLADTTVTYNGSTQTGTSTNLADVLGSAVAGRNAGAYRSGYYSTQQGYDISGGGMTIDKLALTGSITSGSSTYGNSLTAGTVVFNNMVSGDDVAAGTVTVNASGNTSSSGHLKAGSYTGIESVGSTLSGADQGNYTFAGAVGDYTVNKLALTGTITAGTSTYGSVLTTGSASFNNVIGTDVVTPGTVAVNTTGRTSSSGNLTAGSHTGVQNLTAIGGADAGNYSYAAVVGDYTVSKLALAGSIGTGNSTYGSALAAGSASFTNVIGADVVATGTVAVNISGNTSSSGNLKAGSYTGVQSLSSLSGADANNYSYGALTGDYTVNQLALSGSIGTGSSTYGSALSAGSTSFNNAMSGDTVAATGTVAINTSGNTSTSGQLKAGSYTGIQSVNGSLAGSDGGNYTFAGAVGDYTVNKLALTGTITAGTSTYGSALSTGSASFNNVIGADVVTPGTVAVNTTGRTSSSGNLTAGSHTGVQNLTAIGGADAGNYSYTAVVGDYTVSKLALSGSIGAGSSTYGSALAAGSASFTNVVGADAVATGTVAVNISGNTSSSGNLKAGSYTGVQSLASLSGADANNYSYGAVTGDYTVSKLALSGTISTGTSTYGSALSAGSTIFNNAANGDAVTAAGTVVINTSGHTSASEPLNIGHYSGIQSVNGSLSGSDASNYTFAGAVGNYTVKARYDAEALSNAIPQLTSGAFSCSLGASGMGGCVSSIGAGSAEQSDTSATMSVAKMIGNKPPASQIVSDGVKLPANMVNVNE